MNDTVAARVANGAAWLDANHPGWEGMIDLATLSVANPCLCPLGQVCGFMAAVDQEVGDGWEDRRGWTQAHGFAMDDEAEVTFAMLDKAWTALIKDRRDSGTLSGMTW